MKLNKNTIALMVATSIISCLITYNVIKIKLKNSSSETTSTIQVNEQLPPTYCAYKIGRLKGFEFIKPLEFAEPECEGNKYSTLKTKILNIIDQNKNSGSIVSASIYLRDFDKGDWMETNAKESFHPGSLMKIAGLMSYLKMEENNPGFLNKKLTLSEKPINLPNQTFNSKQIEFGKTYTVKQLLEYMISYSDNNATALLHQVLNIQVYNKTYEYIGLPYPNVSDSKYYTITPKDYSTFFKVLYNAGYIDFKHSDYALKLLSKCDFKNGFVSGLPLGTPLVHKFGEWSDGKSNHELHESGIIYLNGTAYLLTVMTSGKDVQKLSAFIANVSKKIYDELDNSTPNTTFIKDNQQAAIF